MLRNELVKQLEYFDIVETFRQKPLPPKEIKFWQDGFRGTMFMHEVVQKAPTYAFNSLDWDLNQEEKKWVERTIEGVQLSIDFNKQLIERTSRKGELSDETAYCYYLHAWMHLITGNLEQTVESLKNAKELSYLNGLIDNAIKKLIEVLENKINSNDNKSHPDSFYHYLIGSFYILLRDPQLARKAFSKAIEIKYDYVEAYFARSKVITTNLYKDLLTDIPIYIQAINDINNAINYFRYRSQETLSESRPTLKKEMHDHFKSLITRIELILFFVFKEDLNRKRNIFNEIKSFPHEVAIPILEEILNKNSLLGSRIFWGERDPNKPIQKTEILAKVEKELEHRKLEQKSHVTTLGCSNNNNNHSPSFASTIFSWFKQHVNKPHDNPSAANDFHNTL